MADVSKFISVLAPAQGQAQSTVELQITSFNIINWNTMPPGQTPSTPPSPVNVTVSVDIGGTTGVNTEKQIAAAICNAINSTFANTLNPDWTYWQQTLQVQSQLNPNLLYGGSPQFESLQGFYAFQGRAIVCDHIVNLWSQAEFAVEVLSQGGAVVVSADIPVYPTLADSTRYGAAMGAFFKDMTGRPMSPDERIGALIMASAELVAIGGWSMIATQYLHETRGFNSTGYELTYYPVLAFDDPAFNGPLYFAIGHQLTTLKAIYDVNCENGTAGFGTVNLPLDYDIIVKQSYIAGLSGVKKILVEETLRLVGFMSLPWWLQEMKGGSGSLKVTQRLDMEKLIRSRLATLFGR